MKNCNKKIIICSVLSFILLAYCAYGTAQPTSPAGHVVFHVGYSIPVTRPLFLHFYSWSLKTFNGGYLPSSVDNFFIYRLWKTDGTSEWRAIIDFQLRQGSSRWGDALPVSHERLRQKVIDYIVDRLDSYDFPQAADAMVLIESLRLGRPLWKGGFSADSIGHYDVHTNQWIWKPEGVRIAREHFKKWWSSSANWSIKKDKNPLDGTGFFISGLE